MRRIGPIIDASEAENEKTCSEGLKKVHFWSSLGSIKASRG